MKAILQFIQRNRWFLVILLMASLTARAEDMKVEARLIWGSDIETNLNNKIKGPRLTAALSKIFKWKNYYLITNRFTMIASNSTASMEMSPKCTLKVKNLGTNRIEVQCFGNGQFIWKGTHSLPMGQWLTLGGPDANDSAWFIALRNVDPNPPTNAPVKTNLLATNLTGTNCAVTNHTATNADGRNALPAEK